MPADDRLRELQRRAYGPGGGLSATEAEELAALQAAVRSGASAAAATAPVSPVAGAEIERPATVETGVGEAPRAPATVETGAEEAAGAKGAAEAPARPEKDPARAADPERGAQRRDDGRGAPRRRRILLPVAALASALLIGLGAGWLLFGRDSGPAMTAEQKEAWTALEASGTYDPGSIRMLGTKYGLTAWYATKSDLKLECVMLTPLPDDTVACATPPDPQGDDAGYWGQLAVSAQLDGSTGATVQVYVVQDAAGEPVAVIDRWEDPGPDNWTTMFQGAELDIAKVIVKETGADGNFLQVIGYDGDTPIWLDQGQNSCLYVADLRAVTTKMCGLDITTQGAKARIEEPGTTYILTVTNHGPVVTVIKGADPTPSSPDEPAIDDTTGKTQ